MVFTTAHCQLMQWLQAEQQLSGVADLKYILLDYVQEGVKKGEITDCGDGMNPVIEKIIDIKPDLLMVSPFENSGGYGQLEEIDIPLMECADYHDAASSRSFIGINPVASVAIGHGIATVTYPDGKSRDAFAVFPASS